MIFVGFWLIFIEFHRLFGIRMENVMPIEGGFHRTLLGGGGEGVKGGSEFGHSSNKKHGSWLLDCSRGVAL